MTLEQLKLVQNQGVKHRSSRRKMNFPRFFQITLVATCYLLLSLISGTGLLVLGASHNASADDFLSLGDNALASGDLEAAIQHYSNGIDSLTDDESLLTVLSLHTNLGSALSTITRNDDAIEHYRNAVSTYIQEIEEIVDQDSATFAKEITAQASFYLGMVLQDEDKPQGAVDAYGYAVVLDPLHWAALANLGSVLHDALRNHDEALQAYNKAYDVLTQTETQPTDPPSDPRFVLSQLQYRIGLCLSHDQGRKCAIEGDPDKQVSCREMATHAFSLAVDFDPDNESAKHMLATMTADTTLTRASNKYVKNLFDDYAHNFEHSLVEELGYNGYERLRRGFDRAFHGAENVPVFSTVVDAGCGTGLVGEQFRNISSILIGVDLSESILDEAEKKRPGLYDERVAADVTEVFLDRKPISLIVAADSYIYFGDLVPLFESMEEGLASDGYLAFTLENVDSETESALRESKPDWRWQLTASGRFAHRKEYVLSVAKSHGLSLVHYEVLDGFRHEHGKDVRGHLFVMRKASSSHDRSDEL